MANDTSGSEEGRRWRGWRTEALPSICLDLTVVSNFRNPSKVVHCQIDAINHNDHDLWQFRKLTKSHCLGGLPICRISVITRDRQFVETEMSSCVTLKKMIACILLEQDSDLPTCTSLRCVET